MEPGNMVRYIGETNGIRNKGGIYQVLDVVTPNFPNAPTHVWISSEHKPTYASPDDRAKQFEVLRSCDV